MSRIGRKPIPIPKGIKVELDLPLLKISGPKGTLAQKLPEGVGVAVQGEEIIVHQPPNPKKGKALQGLTRTLIANMIKGVSQGFERVLEINGVGYRVELQGNVLNFNLGYSHPIRFPLPEGIKAEVEKQTKIILRGIDKHLLGLTAAEIRSLRPPEPYGGKGIKYAEEIIHRKAGKTAVG